MIRGKRGQQLTLGTIILIILGVFVLVFLIFGFNRGWGNLWEELTNLGGGDANVDTIARACEIACSTNSRNAFCDQNRTLNLGGDSDPVTGTCDDFVKGQKGFSPCPSITC